MIFSSAFKLCKNLLKTTKYSFWSVTSWRGAIRLEKSKNKRLNPRLKRVAKLQPHLNLKVTQNPKITKMRVTKTKVMDKAHSKSYKLSKSRFNTPFTKTETMLIEFLYPNMDS